MTKDELEDQKLENEAMKTAKEKAKRESKKQIQKIIWHAVKAAVIPFMILFAKIMAVVLLVCVVVSLFQSVLNFNNDDSSTTTDQEYTSSSSEQTGEIDITDEDWQLTRSQIEQFIENYETGNEELRTELLENRIEQIYNWQEETGYSAGLIIAIALEENKTNFDDFLEEMNEKGNIWKEAGYKTVKEIAQDYIGDETAEEWANTIIEPGMQEAGEALGIIVYGEKSISGDGYDNVYVSKTGKMYRNYKQIKGTYAQHVWSPTYNGSPGTIYNNGCALTSIAVVISGYQNRNVSPLDVVNRISNNTGYVASFNPMVAFSSYGIEATRPQYNSKSRVINHVQTGKPVIIHVLKEEESTFTDGEHWMAILDYNETTDELYVSNPSATRPTKTGWIDADMVLRGCTEYFAIMN